MHKKTLVVLTTVHLLIAIQHVLNCDADKKHLKVRTQKALLVQRWFDMI